MRKITRESVNKFFAGENFSKDNTIVKATNFMTENLKSVKMYLHGNLIAERITDLENNTLELRITHAGWTTNTTKERLNGILDYLEKGKIYQKEFCWYYNNEPMKSGFNEVIV